MVSGEQTGVGFRQQGKVADASAFTSTALSRNWLLHVYPERRQNQRYDHTVARTQPHRPTNLLKDKISCS